MSERKEVYQDGKRPGSKGWQKYVSWKVVNGVGKSQKWRKRELFPKDKLEGRSNFLLMQCFVCIGHYYANIS